MNSKNKLWFNNDNDIKFEIIKTKTARKFNETTDLCVEAECGASGE